ncbi:ergothioneine biosynthesis protein EgtB [Arthrobacter sp. MMS18-M83]|uniref:ergothioneine biosynthesis protein EgtB n=1 Tax=Arthrobacter sp. MMS18-M83 TaxID=2996261 RepID=UPI00227A114D|nr:ergothioneine biosynthesis protein EgtB [Arthrobacter sp. MMS18-M83]WAH97389.1 ergothioneine biosynthesis protein EgtB [Arthrobacter sp. MMS18-M83]
MPDNFPGSDMGPETLRAFIADGLERARKRTHALTACDEEDLLKQHSPLMSPLVWDLAHVGSQEEIWLVRDVGKMEPVRCDIDQMYDAFEHPRSARPSLPLLSPEESRKYLAQVRAKALDILDRTPLEGPPLLDRGFAFGMIIQHEQQHDETMLATHQLRVGVPVLQARTLPVDVLPPDRHSLTKEVLIPAGPFMMGTSVEPWALDNERPAHEVHVPGYWIDTVPVTNGAFRSFIGDGGYRNPRWWTAQGWTHVKESGLVAPKYWERDGDQWIRTRFGVVEPVPEDEPVQHVCWFEADAYARWAGRRLPTEAEWEKAARHDPQSGRSLRYPWGDEDPSPHHANLGGSALRPSPAGSYPCGASPLGVRQLIGDVWEWVSNDFRGYPGFNAFPYQEYSEVFFGSDYKVLRGGSWAVDPAACRGTFRNWDYPIRRQIFSGFRTARDAAPDEVR